MSEAGEPERIPGLGRVSGRCASAAGAACARGAALEGAAFFLAHTSPDAGILVVVDGPLQADALDDALAAYGLRFGHLTDGGPRVPDGEEQLGVDCQSCCLAAPIHMGPPCVTVRCGIWSIRLSVSTGHVCRARWG